MKYAIHQVIFSDDALNIIYSVDSEVGDDVFTMRQLFVRNNVVNSQIIDMQDSASEAIDAALSYRGPDRIVGDPLEAIRAIAEKSGIKIQVDDPDED
jgi:hypothetical protein